MKKLISLLLSMAMVFSMTAVQALAADEETVTLYLADGNITISETGYSINNGVETPFTGKYEIRQGNTTNDITENNICVKSGNHKITMYDASIDTSGETNASAFSIASGASVELVIAGQVTLKSCTPRAGLSVPTGATVVISEKSSGSLKAVGGHYRGAGIGGDDETSSGNITILSGTVDAVGGDGAAGIGGGYRGTGTDADGTIRISGGTVTATGKGGGAGIGGGCAAVGVGQNGNIIIDDDAVVIASSEGGGAGIGGGCGADGTGEYGKIVLRGTANVTASSSSGAGIGSGQGSDGDVHLTGKYGEVLITDNVMVNANSNTGAAIGGGEARHYQDYYAYGNGKTYYADSYGTGEKGKLTISGNANVTAISTSASGIGGGVYKGSTDYAHPTDRDGVISISENATVKATGYFYGIGGMVHSGILGNLNISGGTVTAIATNETAYYASGIDVASRLTITGGVVNASGVRGINSATIGGGVVNAKSLEDSGIYELYSCENKSGWVFSSPKQISNKMSGGVLFSGSEGKIIGSSYTLPADREIPVDTVMTVEEDQELTVPVGTTLKVNGKLIVNGKLVVAGTLNTAETGAIEGSGETEITGKVTGKKLPITIQAQNMSTMEKTFDVSTLFTIPQTAGAAAYTVTKDGTPVTLNGTTLSIPDGGVFTVTVTTEETANYQAASATATLTATVHNHQLRAVAAKAPDCLNAGNIAYWVCESGCGKYFRDADGTQVITLEETVLPATGHQFNNGVCTACGAKDPAYQTNAVIEAGSLTTYPGDTIKVPISVRNNPGISSIKLTVTYDPAVLGYKGCTFNEALTSIAGSQTVVNDTQSGRVVLSWVVANAAYTDAKGDIAVLDFEVKSVAENTSSPVSISYEPESTFDNNLVDQKFLIKNGTVQVNMIRPGDINGDGTVKVNDALLLLNYVCDLRKDEVKGNPDVNGDGKVNNKDVVILLRYIAKFEGITLY